MRRKMTWVDAIEEVIRNAGRPLHVREIADLVARKGFRKNPQTVSERCQRDARFTRTAPATFDLVGLWKNPGETIQSMITVKAGTRLGKRRDEIIRRLGHCQKRGCCSKANLRLHHKYRKADVFRDIVKNHGLTFRPEDPIRNILRGFALLLNDRRFHDKRYVMLLCKAHHDEVHEKKGTIAEPRRRG